MSTYPSLDHFFHRILRVIRHHVSQFWIYRQSCLRQPRLEPEETIPGVGSVRERSQERNSLMMQPGQPLGYSSPRLKVITIHAWSREIIPMCTENDKRAFGLIQTPQKLDMLIRRRHEDQRIVVDPLRS